jgi:hypothetical protein
MIEQVSAGGIPGYTPKSLSDFTRANTAAPEKASVRSERIPAKPDVSREDSVRLSLPAQARILRREGQSIPQIAIRLGLSITTVDAFFKE